MFKTFEQFRIACENYLETGRYRVPERKSMSLVMTDLFQLAGKYDQSWTEPSYQYMKYHPKLKIAFKILKYNYTNVINFEIRRLEVYDDDKLAGEYYHVIADPETLAKMKLRLPRVLNQMSPFFGNKNLTKDNIVELIAAGSFKLQAPNQARKELKEWIQHTTETIKQQMTKPNLNEQSEQKSSLKDGPSD